MRKNIKNFVYTLSSLILGFIIASCDVKDKDEEIDKKIVEKVKQLNEKAQGNKQNIEQAEEFINCKQVSKANLGKNNQYLKEELEHKKEEILKILQEIYDDTRHNSSDTYTASCETCCRQVVITYDKFYEMTRRYNTGWTRHYSYKWFLWWKWGYKTDSFEFHKCPQCMTNEDVVRFDSYLKENINEIAKIEAELVKAQLELNENREMLQERNSSVDLFEEELRRMKQLRQERDKEKEEKLNAQKKAVEKEEENAQLRKEKEQKIREIEDLKKQQLEKNLNIAKLILKSNVPIAIIMEATGLSKEEIEQILSSS